MDHESLLENSAFTEWYHYLLLFIWLILLMVGFKFYHLIESMFQAKEGHHKGQRYGVSLLISSFIIGILLFMVMVFKPAQVEEGSVTYWTIAKYFFYGLFFLLVGLNTIYTIRSYESRSILLRLTVLTILMLIYFYSGMLGGLMVIAFAALIIVIYTFIKFKNILKIG